MMGGFQSARVNVRDLTLMAAFESEAVGLADAGLMGGWANAPEWDVILGLERLAAQRRIPVSPHGCACSRADEAEIVNALRGYRQEDHRISRQQSAAGCAFEAPRSPGTRL